MAIARRLLDHILGEAETAPGREICGLLFGDEGVIRDARPAANVAPDPRRHFEVDPQALFVAIRAERAGGPRMIGHYHSHPGGAPIPSARDLADAEPGRLWLIIAHGTARLWRSRIGGFDPVALVVAGEDAAQELYLKNQ